MTNLATKSRPHGDANILTLNDAGDEASARYSLDNGKVGNLSSIYTLLNTWS
jgi:hypothetical protein